MSNEELRAQINNYFDKALRSKREPTESEIERAVLSVIEKYPAVLDYYIVEREEHGREAVSVSRDRVKEAESLFIRVVRSFVREMLVPSGFYDSQGTSFDEAVQRIKFLKDVIENKGGHRIFYSEGRPIHREADLHILYRLTWFAHVSDVTREANDGRGPVDFKVSYGSKDKTLVEFKLASNSQLERNLERQLPVYEKASDASNPSLKVIIYFTDAQLQKVKDILKRLGMEKDGNIFLIDARSDDKPSGSKA